MNVARTAMQRDDVVARMDRGSASDYRHAMDQRTRRTLGVARWFVFGALALLFVTIVQSVWHPARLWSSGRLGRVLAWGTEPSRAPAEASTEDEAAA